jgi:uncharacterized membrane protein YgcG
MKRIALLSLVALTFLAQPALAADDLSNAVSGLKSSPVYVAGNANPTISASDASNLVSQIGGDPIFIAVIPDTGSGYDSLPQKIGQGVGKAGVFAVISGKHFRAGSSGVLSPGRAGSLATQSFQNESPGKTGSLVPLLQDFVKRTHAALTSPSGTSNSNTSTNPTPHKSHALAIFLYILLGLTVLGGMIFAGVALSRRSKRLAEESKAREKFEQAKRSANARLSKVSDDVVSMGSTIVDPKPKAVYGQGLDAFNRATTILGAASTYDDISDANSMINDAENAMSDVRAYLDGRDPVAERKQAEKDAAEAAKVAAATRAARQKEQAKVEAERRKLAKTVTPKNYQPSTSSSSTTNNYFGGGYYGGNYYGPGYYNNPFWTYVMMDSLFDHSQYDYDNGNYGSYDTTDVTDSYNDSGSSGGDWSSSSSDSGGDWSSASSSSDYSSSSSDSGGGDFGGGGDSGGGGGDW